MVDSIISDSEIEEYYDKNLNKFKLNEDLIKFRFVKIPLDNINLNKIRNGLIRYTSFDMELIDLQPQSTHGGSMRYFISHKGSYEQSNNVEKIINKEINLGLNKESTFRNFSINIQNSKIALKELLKTLKSQGKKIAGYGATSKSTTILNYCNIGPDLIFDISNHFFRLSTGQ